jgi:hypothetical protein
LDAFWIDQTEVTNDLYVMCLDDGQCDDPKGDKHSKVFDYSNYPVSANWEMAAAYCLWAGARLPTEAEWEKAARGGLMGKEYPWGDEHPSCQPGVKNGAQSYECSGRAIEVKTFMPNGYGLYDMTGNVWEWVADWYSVDYYTNSPSINPKGPTSGSVRAMRGGSWVIYDGYVRTANRSGINPTDIYESFGFRCAQDAPQTLVLTPTPLSTDSPTLDPDATLIEYGQDVENSKLPGAPPAIYGFVGEEGDNISMVFVGKGAKGNLLDQSRSILDQFNNVGVNSYVYEFTLPYSGVYYFIVLEPDSRDYHYRFSISINSKK